MKKSGRSRMFAGAVLLTLLAPLLASCTVVTGGTAPMGPNYVAPGYPVSLWLPPGWASANATPLISHRDVLATFNSWGEPGFWPKPEETDYPNGSHSSKYTLEILASRAPHGGAYVALFEDLVPVLKKQPNPPRTLQQGKFYRPHDWRRDASSYAAGIPLYRNGQPMTLFIVCKADASDETVARLNELLASWYFMD